MKRRLAFFSGLLSLALCVATAQAQVLVDGGFELATGGTATSNSPWSLSVNTPNGPATDLSAQFQTAAFARSEGLNGLWFKAFTGNQGNPPSGVFAQATLTQSVLAVLPFYTLTFDAKKEANFTAATWDVSISSSGTGGSDSINLLTAATGSFANYSLNLAGVSPGDTLTVTARMVDGRDAAANPQSAFLDNFVLTASAVPEPSTVALGVAALMGLVAIRRR